MPFLRCPPCCPAWPLPGGQRCGLALSRTGDPPPSLLWARLAPLLTSDNSEPYFPKVAEEQWGLEPWVWRGLTGISCPSPQPRFPPTPQGPGPCPKPFGGPSGGAPAGPGAEPECRHLSPPHGEDCPALHVPCAPGTLPLSLTLAKLEAENDQISIFFFFLMKCHCWRWRRQASGSISRPWCLCSLVVGQGGHLPKPRTCLHLPGVLTGPALLPPSLPPSQNLQPAYWCSCLTGFWVSGWDEAGCPPQLGACEETPSPDPWLPAAPLPAPHPCPPCISLWVSWSFIFCKCHLYK